MRRDHLLRSVPSPTTYYVPNEVTSPRWGQAFAKGCGGPLTSDLTSAAPTPNGFASFCTPPTWPLLDATIAAGFPWFYGDHAFWRRGKYYRCAANAYQFQPTPAHLYEARPHRLQMLGIDIAPSWRTTGSTIVICPNSDVYMRHYGIDARRWAGDLAAQLASVTDRSIIIRWKSTVSRRPLYVDLVDAWAVVTYSSAAAIEAVTAGVPAFALAPWATAAVLGNTSLNQIESPQRPTWRLPFLWSLAEQQWTLAEMASGMTWSTLHHAYVDRSEHISHLHWRQPGGTDRDRRRGTIAPGAVRAANILGRR